LKVVIPPKSNRKIQYEYDKDTYRLRGRVEQCIGKYKEYRRVATRYDKLAAHYLGFVILAAIRNILKTIC
jgi:transposase